MNSHSPFSLLRANGRPFTFPLHNFSCKQSLPFLSRKQQFLPFNHFHLIRSINYQVVGGMRLDGLVLDADELKNAEDADIEVEICATRSLPPALTLEHGLQSIKETIEELKLNPPNSPSGILRFQVAVPPIPKALDWFCCQPESSPVYPLFYLSMQTENSGSQSLNLNRTCGVFGIGAAVYFQRSPSCMPGDQRLIKRYLSNDTGNITVYGFNDINFTSEPSSISNEAGSFYFFIPQIELVEYDDVYILAATLAWDESSLSTFEEGIHSYESSLHQVSSHFCPTMEHHLDPCIKSTLLELNALEDKTTQMAYISSLSFLSGDFVPDHKKLREAPSSGRFCFRFSLTAVISANMIGYAGERTISLQDIANINALWASLIVEECSRLGLTYFCIAPGSRSSPLAVAASAHPLATCVACYDERSLAFHAVGYARGSHKPAVVITSSGTAVSNLLPAVVEASQGFLPLLLLTADRPPELLDTGANQAINQVNHFGAYVRFFFSLPPPNDCVPARMVLTTLDSAVYQATSSPCGPVHINCAFREPLDNSPKTWMSSCLKGLDFWMSSFKPFTTYMDVQRAHGCNSAYGNMASVLDVIQNANKGLLLVGSIHTEEEMWAIVLLAKHLQWPIFADILSGLRFRKLLTAFPEIQDKFLFVDHLDHALLPDSIRAWIQIDVVLQIGSRITSKRICQMLEECLPSAYIVVGKHPFRHDPSHIVTHRIQSNVVQFADMLLKVQFPLRNCRWRSYLQALNMMVDGEIEFQISAENSLTEPHIARVISDALSLDCALFIGNSMAIRDADTFGRGWSNSSHGISDMVLNTQLLFSQILVAGNRGASGIDGLLSTAAGFAVGCKKRSIDTSHVINCSGIENSDNGKSDGQQLQTEVFCVIGDVSFLHDTNGLAILNKRILRRPMTVIVTNNHGGAIFSLLPIANRADPMVLNQYFYTSHDISIRKLCEAHGVKHLPVRTKEELQRALFTSQHEDLDCVVEVESSIDSNAAFHSTIRKSACQAADRTLCMLSKLSAPDSTSDGFFLGKIHKIEYSTYRIQLHCPLTSRDIDYEVSEFYREGFIISLFLEDGIVGFGEVAPLDIHKESLLDVEEQLRFLMHMIRGAKINCSLPLLNGSFSSWIWNCLGIPANSLLPSVRCGMEMAILNAIASRQSSSLLNLLQPSAEAKTSAIESNVRICALIDSNGAPAEVADIAARLVQEGFCAIKLKVARRADPLEDAAVIHEVRKKVGWDVEIRVDANRRWTYQQALQFGFHVKSYNLRYIEEPVQSDDDILKFCEETGLPVALDETIDNMYGDFLQGLMKYTHPGIVAVIIKPSALGGFENSALVAKWAQKQGKMAVVSAAFESSLGLSAYTLFSSYLELQKADISTMMGSKLLSSVAHGLGTYQWLREDTTNDSLAVCYNPHCRSVVASAVDASRLLQTVQINRHIISRTSCSEHVRSYDLTIESAGSTFLMKVQELGNRFEDNVLIFLHGFLGTSEEWIPIMNAISGSARCISIDLPGHGRSKVRTPDNEKEAQKPRFSIEIVTDILCKLIHHITPGKVTLVGYSMGARIALYMSLKFNHMINGAVIISGSPGLKDPMARKIRKAKDDARGRFLVSHGLKFFLENWYAGGLWKSLRRHPHFKRVASSRFRHDDLQSLAKALSDLSIGRQPSLWQELNQCNIPLLLMVGKRDEKFKKIAKHMWSELHHCKNDLGNNIHEVVEIPESGHAAHLENPLSVISALRQYLKQLKESSLSE